MAMDLESHKEEQMSKLTSRKFWLAVAAFLASIGGSITGIVTNNEVLMSIGIACTVFSAAIYAAAEAYVDGKSAASETIAITATTSSKDVVEQVIAASKQPVVETPPVVIEPVATVPTTNE